MLGALLSVVYLVLGAMVYVVAAALFDGVAFAYTVPTSFVETFNNTMLCDGMIPNQLTLEEVRVTAVLS